jgi:Putative MetA-pathway of phenol degradation
LKIRLFVSVGSIRCLCAIFAFSMPVVGVAQDSFFTRWQARASATQALQPKWMVPAVSPYPQLIQVFRSDFSRQISSTHVTTWNLGTSRGLNLIPFARTEFDIFVPPFFVHSDKTPDGFGDFSMAAKYRIAAGNEQHGNYVVSASVTASVPTGSYKNGSPDASINPTVAAGKGWKKFDFAACLGGTLPTGDTKTIGRTIAGNAYGQIHLDKYFWPELEVNSTAWFGGARDGKVQTFLTPGLMTGKYALHPGDPHSRPGFVAGVGFQTAVTSYHVYNHNLVFTGRFVF